MKRELGNSNHLVYYKRVKKPSSVSLGAGLSNVNVVVEVSKWKDRVCNLYEAQKGVNEGNVDEKGLFGGVSGMEVEAKGENGEKKLGEKVFEGIVREEGNVEVKVEGENVEKMVEKGENVVVNGNVNNLEKESVLEETVSKMALKVGDSGIKRYKRRGTRLKLENNGDGELNGSLGDECARRACRSSLVGKTKEEGTDSCLTETSDSVLLDKENVDIGSSNENENENENENDHLTGNENENEDEDEDENRVCDMADMHRLLEMKLLEQIGIDGIPTTARELFETGLLEGCPVYYDGGKGPGLRGRIRAIGICCPCNLCRGCKVIPPSLFEIHAANTYKRAVQYIHLENGRSFIQVLKTCKTTRLKTYADTVQNAIGPLPERIVVVCQNCKESFLTMDAECSVPVCSACIMSNLSPIGPVYSARRLCRSSKFGIIQPTCGKLFGKGKSVKKQASTSLISNMRSSSRTGRPSKSKIFEKATKSSKEVVLVPKACSSPVMGKSVTTKSAKKLIIKPSEVALTPKPSTLTRVGKSSKIDSRAKVTKRSMREILTPKAFKTPSASGSSKIRISTKITRKDLRLHRLVFEDDVLPDGTELGYYARGKKLLDGFKHGSGIFCNCCETVISASQFEAHAGCAAKRKPYCYIYTSNGVSLHELSINLIKGRRHSKKFNDDLCSICADGGDLLLCDGCPRAFHTECASLSTIPNGKWYCKYCENMFEREKFVSHNDNALAAGRVSGVDPMEQITKRSIRIVNNVGSDVSSCILCRGFDFCKSGFGPRTIILCDQCEKEYHVGCLKDHDMADLTELPDGKWFCSLACGRIDSALQNLLMQGSEKLPESLLNIIRGKNLQNVSESTADVDISWRLLSGKIASPEIRPLLSQAVAIFHESFSPIVEVVSGHDLIPTMVYGRNVGGQEYGGMYCAVLTVNSVVVSAAIFRVFGPEVAELPLVATSSGNHGKGYFQALFACIERILSDLKIKTFVLPAAEEAESIWIDRFCFRKMMPDQLHQLKSNFWSLVHFEGTSMLQKSVPEYQSLRSLVK